MEPGERESFFCGNPQCVYRGFPGTEVIRVLVPPRIRTMKDVVAEGVTPSPGNRNELTRELKRVAFGFQGRERFLCEDCVGKIFGGGFR